MKAQDIIWGGSNKCELTLGRDIGIREDDVIDVTYNYTSMRYEVSYKSEKTGINIDFQNKEILDNIFLSGFSLSTIVRVIDIEELNLIVEIKIFQDTITFNEFQAIQIEVSEDVIAKMRAVDKQDPIRYLNKNFKYQDMLFVRGYGKKGINFTLLSKDRALDITYIDKVYIAKNLLRYDRGKADLENVYILKGNITFVPETQGRSISKETLQRIGEIQKENTYMEIWNAYNDLERLFILKQAAENGIIEYESYKCKMTDVYEYTFQLKSNYEEPFPENAHIDCTENKEIRDLEQLEDLEDIQKLNSIHIGTFVEMDGNYCKIVDKIGCSEKKLPNKGFLYYSVAGDIVRMIRREQAKKDILEGKSSIQHLRIIIEQGVGIEHSLLHEQAVTNMLKRKMPNYEFNEKQKNAIEVALNTPDIALILGPPGTGKTTVIKAIITRFEEWFKKNNESQISRILISSFQHEAVENVIVGVDSNGIPSDRKGGKYGGENKQTANIRNWRENVIHTLQGKVQTLTKEIDYSQETLADQIFAWEKKGMDPLEGIILLKDTITKNRVRISSELSNEANMIIARATVSEDTKVVEKKEWEIEEENEIIQILESQRLTPEGYADDGKRQIITLKVAIFEGEIDAPEGLEIIDAVLKTKGKDENSFSKYVSLVEKLRQKYGKEKSQSTAISSDTALQTCLKRLDKELQEERRKRLENKDEAIAYILQKYMELIQDEKEIKQIVETYSNITAATCQQAMGIGRNASNQKFDLVIVDEAARANPLDLLIPMSMGKKIILVGDFLQLPHMLEPEVTKHLERDKKLESLNILKKSLFQRMYEMFDNSDSKLVRTVQLEKQYRMHSMIGNFVNSEIYAPQGFRIDSGDVDDTKKTANLGLYENKPMVWLNMNKNQFGIEIGKRSKSRSEEASLIIREVKKILKIDSSKKIGIITFYKKQAEILEEMCKKDLRDSENQQIEVGTVDAFQGKEFDVVFLSCVRANNHKTDAMRYRVGHLQDRSRLCVSLTRAKQLLIIVGDRDTVECVPILEKFIRECEMGAIGYYEQIERTKSNNI